MLKIQRRQLSRPLCEILGAWNINILENKKYSRAKIQGGLNAAGSFVGDSELQNAKLRQGSALFIEER